MTSTGEWSLGLLADAAGLLAVRIGLLACRIGAWNHMAYPENVPPLGERNAEAIKAGHGAIEVIDGLIRDLHSLRGQLVSELRADEDARASRVDAMLPTRPEWLYGSGCCEHWTPEHGCSAGHTGRPAMSRAARDLDGGTQ